jgi:hypothetical protein
VIPIFVAAHPTLNKVAKAKIALKQ